MIRGSSLPTHPKAKQSFVCQDNALFQIFYGWLVWKSDFFVKTLFHYLEEKGYVTYSTQAGSGVSPERACLRCQAPGFFQSSEEFASLCPPEGNQEWEALFTKTIESEYFSQKWIRLLSEPLLCVGKRDTRRLAHSQGARILFKEPLGPPTIWRNWDFD